MQKIPLHPDEMRIGFFPAKSPFNWTIVILIVVAVAAFFYFKSVQKRKKQDEGK